MDITKILNLKISAILLLLYSASLYASEDSLRVLEIKGNAFVSHNGVTKYLKANDVISSGASVITEEGGMITLVNYFDQKYVLSGSSTAKFGHRKVELGKGVVWVTSTNDLDQFSISTPLSKTDYKNTEFVLSFDEEASKAQLMTVRGHVDFYNINDDDIKVMVIGGHFSFVDPQHDNGIPRYPTLTSKSSFNKVLALFDNKTKEIGRSIASLDYDLDDEDVKNLYKSKKQELKDQKKEIIFVPKSKSIVKTSKKIKIAKKFIENKKDSKVIVKIFGNVEKTRSIASIDDSNSDVNKLIKELKMASVATKREPASVSTWDTFEKSLNVHQNDQKKHSDDVTSLIESLKSYQADYSNY